jgi:hypothetical protein
MILPTGTENQVIRVLNAGGPLEFSGTLLGEVSTQINRSPRWTEISLYKVTDGTQRYVLHSCGASVVYHKHNGPCNTGVPTHAEDMPLDGEPCRVCRPARVPDDPEEWYKEDLLGTQWDLETDRHTTHVCKDPKEVVEKLRFPRSNKILGGTLSGPAQRLLNMVAKHDPDIAAVLQEVQRI